MNTLIFLIAFLFFQLIASLPHLKIHSCGDDLKHLLSFVCTYPDKKLPCFSHFLDEDEEENPLKIIDAMRQRELQHEFDDTEKSSIPTPINNHNFTLIEQCCHKGCEISQVKTKYCCFSEFCLNLCYPKPFDVFNT